MRTLKLTHGQIETLTHSLGLAEKAYNNLHKQICEASEVRGTYGKERADAMLVFERSNTFSDLNSDLMSGKFDV